MILISNDVCADLYEGISAEHDDSNDAEHDADPIEEDTQFAWLWS